MAVLSKCGIIMWSLDMMDGEVTDHGAVPDVGILFASCAGLLQIYRPDNPMTIQRSDDLAERHRKAAS